MALTRTQRSNLAKLADYLEGLPRRYRHFDMREYMGLDPADHRAIEYGQKNGGVSNCGTVACAIGHGPSAGILFRPTDFGENWRTGLLQLDWDTYAERFVGGGDFDFQWAFGAEWKFVDNHHWGAAARIRYLLKHGAAPEAFGEAQRHWRKLYRAFDKRHAEQAAA